MKKIAFIGLGVMGFHMASHLIKKNLCVNIIDRCSHNTKKFIKKYNSTGKIKIYSELKELASYSDIIITCVGNDKDLKDIFFSQKGIMSGIKKGSIIVDHTTASINISLLLSKSFQKKKCFFYDAPISGGEQGAVDGTLSIMVGGDKRKIYILKNTIDAYYKSLIYMGKSGNGQLTKMVNQICVASIIQGLSEGMHLALSKNLNIKKLIEVLKNGAGQSWQLENRALTMSKDKFNFGFMNRLMLKDLNLIFEEVKNDNINLPVTKEIKKYYKKLVDSGLEKLDTSSLIKLLNN